MQIKAVVLIIVCIFTVLVFGSSFVLSKNHTEIVTPISDVVSAKAAEKINSPTPSPSPTNEPTSTPLPTPTSTPIPTPIPIIIAPADLENLFTKYSSEYNVDKELLKRIANCESSFNPNAINMNYAGLFQFSESLWRQTRTLMGLNSDANLRLNAEEAIRTAAFMVSQNHLYIWPNCSS